jgi:hypothetical protein
MTSGVNTSSAPKERREMTRRIAETSIHDYESEEVPSLDVADDGAELPSLEFPAPEESTEEELSVDESLTGVDDGAAPVEDSSTCESDALFSEDDVEASSINADEADSSVPSREASEPIKSFDNPDPSVTVTLFVVLCCCSKTTFVCGSTMTSTVGSGVGA